MKHAGKKRLIASSLALVGLINGIVLSICALAQTKLLPTITKSTAALSKLSALDQSRRAKINQTYGELPLSFEANRGQANRRV
jgi:hypothetical protein